MKIFYCGLCKKEKRKAMIRSVLRKHLREEHGIRKEITNSGYDKDSGYLKNRWWIEVKI